MVGEDTASSQAEDLHPLPNKMNKPAKRKPRGFGSSNLILKQHSKRLREGESRERERDGCSDSCSGCNSLQHAEEKTFSQPRMLFVCF